MLLLEDELTPEEGAARCVFRWWRARDAVVGVLLGDVVALELLEEACVVCVVVVVVPLLLAVAESAPVASQPVRPIDPTTAAPIAP